MKKTEITFLIIILLFALFLRVYALGQPGMWVDETISGIASREILEKGVPVFDSGASYIRAYVFHYLQSFFMFSIKSQCLATASIYFFSSSLDVFLLDSSWKIKSSISFRIKFNSLPKKEQEKFLLNVAVNKY